MERWERLTGGELAAQLGLPRVEVRAATGSTMDDAHALAAGGAPAGTLVLADVQQAGRGRHGRPWTSRPGAGIWLTLLARELDPATVGVLSLRLGIHAAAALDAFAEEPVRLKWPNDLYVQERKLGGILVEARWRDARLEWAALGVGINVAAPADVPGASGLQPGVSRREVLQALVPALVEAASRRGQLTPAELAAFGRRDLARGRQCVSPEAGRVVGLAADGALVVERDTGPIHLRTGSLVLREEAS